MNCCTSGLNGFSQNHFPCRAIEVRLPSRRSVAQVGLRAKSRMAAPEAEFEPGNHEHCLAMALADHIGDNGLAFQAFIGND